jgi:hypothetical protein
MRQNYRLELATLIDSEVAVGTSQVIDLDNSMGFCVAFKKTDSSLSNKTFSEVSIDAFEITDHGYKTGLKVRFTTTGVLPTGLALLTDYYLIRISDDVLMVAETQEDAASGVYLAISGGSGTHTVSVQTFMPCYVKLEGSLDSEQWFEVAVQEIGDTLQRIEHEVAFFAKLKVSIINQSGQREIYSKIMTKGF